MNGRRAGLKRKVEEPSTSTAQEDAPTLISASLDEGFSESEDSEDEEADLGSEDGLDEEDELDSDEIPSEDDGDSELPARPHKADLVGSDTAAELSTLSPKAPVQPLLVEEDDLPNYREDLDANGNPRYLYDEIDPVYDSDDSALEVTNTIGDIPLSYYDAYPHIGYDINGKKISRPAKGEALDSLLDSIDIPEGWTGLTDPATGKPLQLNSEQLDVLKQLTQNETPGDGYDPYPDMVEYFTSREEIMPLSAAPEPKRRFVPSMHEHKRVMKMVKAIKEGRIQPWKEPKPKEEEDEEEEEQDFASFDIWANETPRADNAMHLPAPKLPPPGYEESYHPPPEYLPDEDERKAWQEQDEEDRTRDFLPQDHAALRRVAGYERFLKERFNRSMDLYLAPRVRRSKLNIDPESLLPKLPDPAELRPFPDHTSIVYKGHQGKVRDVAIDATGSLVASAGDDGTVRVWDLQTGYCLQRVRLSDSDPVHVVTWRPGTSNCTIAACCGDQVHFIVPTIPNATPDAEQDAADALTAGFGVTIADAAKTNGSDAKSIAAWHRPIPKLAKAGVVLSLSLRGTPKTLTWHRRGDYFATVCPSSSATSTAVAIHTLSKHLTQHPFKRLRGLAQTARFHPSKPLFFAATRQRIRVYDLQKQKLEKELQPGVRWISSISLHPLGSNLLVSSFDRRLLWHDLDMGNTPYKTLRYHGKAIRDVKFHPALPLFADASDDGSMQIFHGRVMTDEMENATIVPLKVLKGHKVTRDLGVLALDWHPREAWCVSGGADGTLRLWT